MKRGVLILGSLLVGTRCKNGSFRCNFARVVLVFVQKLSWIDPYLDCGCTTSDDNPLFNVSGWKVVREFSNGMKEI